MSGSIHAFDFLDEPSAHSVTPVCVVFGDDRFLKQLVLASLRDAVEGGEGAHDVSGMELQWRDICDELYTVSLFGGGRRFVQVSQADKFVSAFRGNLEGYVERPSSASILVLEVCSWPSNTRLYKAVAKTGLVIECGPPQRTAGRRKEPDHNRLIQWLVQRCHDVHRAKLTRPAGTQLIELVGLDIGRLDQELAKLAVYVGVDGTVTPDTVVDVVGGWRAKTTWELLDAATDGDAVEALRQLDRLLLSGEAPQAIFGAMSWSLRRFADATRIIQRAERHGQRANLRGALEAAGFRKWPPQVLPSAERQLRQIGRHRAGQLYRWLLDADLALKGTHSTPDQARFVLEHLIVRLAAQN